MAWLEKIYEVEIGGHWRGFFLEQKSNGIVWLSIPDAGGQADMSPKYPDQLEWLLPQLEGLSGLERIWPTIWVIPSDPVLFKVEQILRREGRLSRIPRSTYY